MRLRWIVAANKILSDVDARAFWDRRIARVEKERRKAEIAPKRRPKMRGSAAKAPVAKATVTPLQREAERIATARSRTEQANQAIAVFMENNQRSELTRDDLDGAFTYLMDSTASTTNEFTVEIEIFVRSKVTDRRLRECLLEKDGLAARWKDRDSS